MLLLSMIMVLLLHTVGNLNELQTLNNYTSFLFNRLQSKMPSISVEEKQKESFHIDDFQDIRKPEAIEDSSLRFVKLPFFMAYKALTIFWEQILFSIKENTNPIFKSSLETLFPDKYELIYLKHIPKILEMLLRFCYYICCFNVC